jgi:predicted ester cyclase
MFEAIPDAHGEITHIVASGDRVAVRTVMSGTDEGGFMPGMPATSKSFETTAIDILRFDDDGKVAEHWGLFDAMTAMMQLGLVPAPPGS